MIGTLRGVKLTRLRRERFLTVQALAERAGVAKSTLVKIEGGKVRQPHLSVVKRLSEALGVPPQDVDEFRVSLGLPPAE